MSFAPALAVEGAANRSASAGSDRLEQMFKDHHQVVWRTLRRFGLEADAAADLTQQTFLIAAERLQDIRLGSERAFLLGTAIRLRRTASRRTQRCALEDDMDSRPGSGSSADELADRRRAVELVDKILSQMDPDLLTVFVLFELEGLSTPEIAKLLNLPLGTAASRLRRARESFRSTAAKWERLFQPKVSA